MTLRSLSLPSFLLTPLASLLLVPLAGAEERLIASAPKRTELAATPALQVAFAPTGDAVAFLVEAKKGRFQAVHARPGKSGEVELDVGDPVDAALFPAISDDGEHAAFAVGDDVGSSKESWTLMLDGKSFARADRIGRPAFWPGTDEVLFWTRPKVRSDGRGGLRGDHVLQRGKQKGDEWTRADIFAPIRFSGDGKRASLYVVDGQDQGFLHLTPKKEKWAEGPFTGPIGAAPFLALDEKGGRWAFEEQRVEVVQTGNVANTTIKKTVVTEDGPIGDDFAEVRLPRFAPRGKDLAVAVRDAETGKWGVWIEGSRPPEFEFDAISSIAWDPAAKGLAVVGLVNEKGAKAKGTERKAVLRTLDKQGRLEDLPAGATPEWDFVRYLKVGPGGAAERDLVFAAQLDGAWHLVRERLVDGKLETWKSAAYEHVAEPVVDGDAIGAGAVRDGDLYWVTPD